ncbi:MAG: VWA domain-containing protein [Vicinamibacterales bacterium]
MIARLLGVVAALALVPAGAAGPAPQAAGASSARGQAAPAPQEPQVFRAGVDVVSLNVTVVDPSGRYVTDLGESDFSVFEDGVKQDLIFFNRTNQPIALSLLIDTSASMEQRLEIAQDAAIGFSNTLRPQDLAQVVDFDSRVQIAQDFTNDKAALERAIRSTAPGGSTSLHNALYISLKELAKMKAKSSDELRREAIVVLSDGEDTSSLVSYEEVLELAKRSETSIYAIGLQPKETASARGFREAEFVLRQLSQETGGRSFFPDDAAALKDIYAQIADELSSQYSLGYTSKNPRRDGAWRRLVVQIDRPNATARTKRGYYAPSSH